MLSLGVVARGQPRYVWLYPVLLGATELVWGVRNPFLALCFHAALVVFLLLRAQVLTGGERDFHIALAALPMVRVVSLSLPLWPALPLAQRIGVALPLMFVAIPGARALNYPLFRLPRPSSLAYVPLQLALGMIVGLLAYALLQPGALMLDGTTVGVTSAVVVALIVIAFGEEVLFRGLLLEAATGLLGPVRGITLAALAYVSLVFGQGLWLLTLLLFVFGLGCGWLAHTTRSLFGVVLLHSVALVTLFVVLPAIAQQGGG